MISRIWYVVAALAFLAGGAGAGMVVWSGISALDQGMIRIVAPGTSVLALSDPALGAKLEAWRARQTAAVAEAPKDGA